MKKDCDVNFIVQKFMKTGQMSHLNQNQGSYADVTGIKDLLDSMSTVTRAQQTFNSLPAVLRKRFGNSPVEFVNFLDDPKNDAEAVKLGLKKYRLDEPLAREQPPAGPSKKNARQAGNDDELNDDDKPSPSKK